MKITFQPNREKIIACLLYVLDKCGPSNKYNILKSMFAADKWHLNQYARPVTGDTYIRMKHGTVPSLLRNIVEEPMFLESGPPFKPSDKPYCIRGEQKPDMTLLSESDVEALDYGINEYMGLSFSEVEKKNHQEKCWINTPENTPIPFESMIENKEVLDYFQETGGLPIVI